MRILQIYWSDGGLKPPDRQTHNLHPKSRTHTHTHTYIFLIYKIWLNRTKPNPKPLIYFGPNPQGPLSFTSLKQNPKLIFFLCILFWIHSYLSLSFIFNLLHLRHVLHHLILQSTSSSKICPSSSSSIFIIFFFTLHHLRLSSSSFSLFIIFVHHFLLKSLSSSIFNHLQSLVRHLLMFRHDFGLFSYVIFKLIFSSKNIGKEPKKSGQKIQ